MTIMNETSVGMSSYIVSMEKKYLNMRYAHFEPSAKEF